MANYYTVKNGDSWAKIAGDVYGDQRMFADLAAANGGANLRPGMQLVLPTKVENPFVSNKVAARFGMATSGEIKDAHNAEGGLDEYGKMLWTPEQAQNNKDWAYANAGGLVKDMANGRIDPNWRSGIVSEPAIPDAPVNPLEEPAVFSEDRLVQAASATSSSKDHARPDPVGTTPPLAPIASTGSATVPNVALTQKSGYKAGIGSSSYYKNFDMSRRLTVTPETVEGKRSFGIRPDVTIAYSAIDAGMPPARIKEDEMSEIIYKALSEFLLLGEDGLPSDWQGRPNVLLAVQNVISNLNGGAGTASQWSAILPFLKEVGYYWDIRQKEFIYKPAVNALSEFDTGANAPVNSLAPDFWGGMYGLTDNEPYFYYGPNTGSTYTGRTDGQVDLNALARGRVDMNVSAGGSN
jgi:hypothetical protein